MNQGEDRFLTHQTLLRGMALTSIMMRCAGLPCQLPCRYYSSSNCAGNRSIVRDFFFTLRTLPKHVWKLHPNTVLTLVLTPLGALVGLLVALTMLSGNPMAWAGPVPLIAYLGDWGNPQLGDQEIQCPGSGETSARLRGLFSMVAGQQPILTPWRCARWIPRIGVRGPRKRNRRVAKAMPDDKKVSANAKVSLIQPMLYKSVVTVYRIFAIVTLYPCSSEYWPTASSWASMP